MVGRLLDLPLIKARKNCAAAGSDSDGQGSARTGAGNQCERPSYVMREGPNLRGGAETRALSSPDGFWVRVW